MAVESQSGLPPREPRSAFSIVTNLLASLLLKRLRLRAERPWLCRPTSAMPLLSEMRLKKSTAVFGPPTIAVHAAGVMPTGTILETSELNWDYAHSVNVKGAFLTCREVIPHMQRAGLGSIVLLASITGVNGLPGLAAYSSTKGALIALARALAIDHATEGIRANSSPLELSIRLCCTSSSRPRRIRTELDAPLMRYSHEDALGP